MFKRLFSRPARSSNEFRKPLLENLENRTLLHNPFIIGATADNRGEATITFDSSSSELSASQFNKNSVQMYLAGPNGHVGDGDDVRLTASIKYTPGTQKLVVRGAVPAGNGYRVKVVASLISPSPGFNLDGNFNGTFPTGDGVAGGNFEFQVKNDKSSTPLARMYTSSGAITLKLRQDLAPKTVKNFLAYANSGRFDNVFWTRSENNPAPFVIQGGSLQITGAGTTASDVVATTRDAPVADENSVAGALSNTIGTLAFAKSGPNTATNQFFINLANNSFLDSPSRGDGGFTVFAQITAGLAVAQTINAQPVANLTTQIGTAAGSTNTGVTNVPVVNKTQAEAALNPFRDLMYMRRIVLLSKIAAV